MPSKKKPDHTALLVQIPDAIHTAADARRHRERATWGKVISTLLARWVKDQQIGAPIRAPRMPPTERAPHADTARRSRVPGAPVTIAPEKWHRSPIAALLAGSGKEIPADLPSFDNDEDATPDTSAVTG